MKILTFENSGISSLKSDPARMSGRIKVITPDTLKQNPHGVVIFGLADDQGVKNVGGRPGAKEGPLAFRRKFFRFASLPLPFPLYDLGDLQPESTIEATHGNAQEVIQLIHASGHFPLIIGGGHDLAFAEAAALLHHMKTKSLNFINLDAHLDLRNTYNGITSGSPWYLLAELGSFKKSKSKLLEFGVQRQCNTGELIEYAEKQKIEILWLQNLREKKSPLEKVLASRLKLGPTLVSLDIDGVRWSDAPGCSAPQNTGFSSSEAIKMSTVAGKSKNVKSFGIYELSPPLDRDDQTAALVARCAYAFLEGFANRFKVLHSQVQSKDYGGKEKKARRRK